MAKIPVKNTSPRALLTLALALLASGWSMCGSNTPPEYKKLFYLPQEQQEERFKQFPLDKQVDIYTYAMYVEPPLTRYAGYLGSSGHKVLPVLLARLEAEESDTAKAHLIYAFQEIHQRHYSLRTERETVDSISRVISSMKDGYRKKQSEEYLKVIKESSGFRSSDTTMCGSIRTHRGGAYGRQRLTIYSGTGGHYEWVDDPDEVLDDFTRCW